MLLRARSVREEEQKGNMKQINLFLSRHPRRSLRAAASLSPRGPLAGRRLSGCAPQRGSPRPSSETGASRTNDTSLHSAWAEGPGERQLAARAQALPAQSSARRSLQAAEGRLDEVISTLRLRALVECAPRDTSASRSALAWLAARAAAARACSAERVAKKSQGCLGNQTLRSAVVLRKFLSNYRV